MVGVSHGMKLSVFRVTLSTQSIHTQRSLALNGQGIGLLMVCGAE